MAARRYATNFKAEGMTLNIAATGILNNLDVTYKNVKLFSDTLLVLDAL